MTPDGHRGAEHRRSLVLLPAIDVAGGRAIRLDQGVPDLDSALADPLGSAIAWQSDGAEWLHLVDLDAAYGRGSNADLLAMIIERLDIRVQLSGGIADDASLQRALSTGCERVVLNTPATARPDWCRRVIAEHGDRIAVSLDVRIESATGSERHVLAPRGGDGRDDDAAQSDLWEVLARLDHDGCPRYVVTDVSRDGMLNGPNVELYRNLLGATPSPIIASGGVSTLDDLTTLADVSVAGAGLEGAVVGRALGAGRFTLAEALATMR